MKTLAVFCALALLPGAALAADLPDWAYPVAPQGLPSKADASKVVRAEGSTKQYTEAQIDDPFGPPDWFPGEHPAMPPVVAHGVKPAVIACGRCHLPDGSGHPESSSLAALPAGYMIRQMEDYAAGRHTGPRKASMVRIAKALSAEDNKASAEYYAALPLQAGYIKVVEQATVPKSYVGEGNMRFVDPKGGTEPLGQRIIELPRSEEQARARNPHFGFVAYVPKGSIARGEKLAKGGNGKTIACASCHGEGLKGLGPVPSLAGRSAIFLVRQLMDMQAGRRTGEWTTLHAPVNAKLDTGDIIALAAYAASRAP